MDVHERTRDIHLRLQIFDVTTTLGTDLFFLRGVGCVCVGGSSVVDDCYATDSLFIITLCWCERILPIAILTIAVKCDKCVKKGGKFSCCFRGASWFKKCGKPPKFPFTWMQGYRVCEGKPTDNDILIREHAGQILYALGAIVSHTTIVLRYSIINNTLRHA